MGGLLWGSGNTLRLSLDRGDLWDERTNGEAEWWKKYTYAKGKAMVDAGKAGVVNSWWDAPYNGVTPTKLPGGRLEIKLSPNTQLKSFELDLATAEGRVLLNDQTQVTTFFSATEPVALMRIPRSSISFELIASGETPASSGGPSSGGAVKRLGYPAAKHGQKGTAKWYVQDGVDGFQYCIFAQTQRVGNKTLLAIAFTSTNDDPKPLQLAKARCQNALSKGYSKMFKPHVAWWKTFWNQSAVSLPAVDAPILRQYYLVQYFYGAASRQGAPPMPLQGVWTADNGGLPPWKGDYHNDLNTQMTYIAYPSAGHFEEGLSYLDFLWDRRQIFHDFARDFYETPGLACPGVMSLAGQPLGGWGQYSMSPTMSAWSAHLFYLHWRYTMDDRFLRERAYPWVSGVGECMLGLLKPNAEGRLVLPLSSSPEIFNNSARAWLEPNSNYDLMSLKMLFLALEEMADALGDSTAAKKWAQVATGLGAFHATDSGKLLISRTKALPGSHRHLSNLMGIHPFNLITVDGGEQDRKIIATTLADWKSKGTRAWTGYSFSWFSVCWRGWRDLRTRCAIWIFTPPPSSLEMDFM
jgi:alpha-L-fucosidase 2